MKLLKDIDCLGFPFPLIQYTVHIDRPFRILFSLFSSLSVALKLVQFGYFLAGKTFYSTSDLGKSLALLGECEIFPVSFPAGCALFAHAYLSS